MTALEPKRRTRHPKGRSEAEEARSALTRLGVEATAPGTIFGESEHLIVRTHSVRTAYAIR